jgi:ComF family protein
MLATAARMLLDQLLPPQCLSCNAVVDAPGSLCAACFQKFTFITAPCCDRCGVPFDAPVIDDLICGACLKNAPSFARARAAFVYGEDSRALMLKLKHGDRTDAAVHLARWLQRAGAELLASNDVLVPVPLHRWRLLMRTYNQAALLANALGKLSGKPVAVDALRRVKSTPSQGKRNPAERRRNVAGAFAVTGAAVSGKRVLLVDDVLTTGATADACARCLLQAGAASVDVLVLARVANV